ncbi:FkbM family methyltransferase [Limnospira fusiformis KN01]|uniref:FkbM family methyltransferase n=1 Tax=Limnospira TaxID=2596745 RepID=UPI001658773B|nr:MULTISPECIES: FkbM family methyltransferase [Limnospira]MDT9199434.1 FkbM family methyltransferase [Limnospira sp. PMC 1042.18]ULB46969.1 FkbM family methyltransferase [Limnospira fusiformis KN01]
MSVLDHAKFLSRLKKNGIELNVFFDVGSNIGLWSCEAQKVYQEAKFHCFEPLIGKQPELDFASRYSELNNYTLYPIALSDYSGTAKIKVLGDRGVGSSILILDSDYRKNTTFIDVDVYTMDDFVKINNLPFPDFIKLDTQASEMKILKGALESLKNAKYLLCETWIRKVYGPETPLFHELTTFLYAHNYVLFEMLSLDEGRDSDQTLRWFDAVFINKSHSPFANQL